MRAPVRITVHLGSGNEGQERRERLEQIADNVGAAGQRGTGISTLLQQIADGELKIQETKMYYVIENAYVGPNHEQHADGNRCVISTAPARGNAGEHPVIIDGWCGTTNDWSCHAYGEFDTLTAARARVAELGYLRPDENAIDEWDVEQGIVERYRFGEYEIWNGEASTDWAYEGLVAAVEAGTPWEEIADELETAGHEETNAQLNMHALRATYERLVEERNEEDN